MAVVISSSYEFGEGHGSLDMVGPDGRAMEQRATAFYQEAEREIVRRRHEDEGACTVFPNLKPARSRCRRSACRIG